MFGIGIISLKSNGKSQYQRWRNYNIRVIHIKPCKKAAATFKKETVAGIERILKVYIQA
jgi:hypothetical protein